MADTPQEATSDASTQTFATHRELLFSIVYSMLGSVADTEDVLQETWLAWAPRNADPEAEPVVNPRGYLVRIAVNRALARQAAIRRRRERYIGPWLPEPLATSDQTQNAATDFESVSIPLLVVLQSLSPLERAVFVLHEVFGYTHVEIAEIVQRSPAATRQLSHRARERVHARRPRFTADPQVQRQVTEQFVAAALGGDLHSLLELLSPDVTMSIDSGGNVPKAARRPVHGREKVARLITGLVDNQPGELELRYRQINGTPSAVLFADDSPFAVMVLDLSTDGEQVRDIYTIANPDKLTRIED